MVQDTQTQIMAAFAKLERIEKLEDHLEEKGTPAAEAVDAKEVEDLDELERLETDERQGAEAGSLDAIQLPPDMLDTIDWDSLSFSAGFDVVVGESSSANVGH